MHQESNLWYESKRSNHINAGRKAKPSDSLTIICAFNYSSTKQKFRNNFCIAITYNFKKALSILPNTKFSGDLATTIVIEK